MVTLTFLFGVEQNSQLKLVCYLVLNKALSITLNTTSNAMLNLTLNFLANELRIYNVFWGKGELRPSLLFLHTMINPPHA